MTQAHLEVKLMIVFDSIWQATQNSGGSTYTFNISICANSPYACAGSCAGPNTAGVCQSWGPAPANAKCFGHWDTANLLGLSKYSFEAPCLPYLICLIKLISFFQIQAMASKLLILEETNVVYAILKALALPS